MRGFEERDRMRNARHLLEPQGPCPPFYRWKPENRERFKGKSRRNRCRERRAGARDDVNDNPPCERGPDKLDAGVRDPGHPRISYQGDRLVSFKAGQKLRQPRPRVVLVKADRGRRNRVMREQLRGSPGVLGRDEVHLAENSQRSQCDVLEVADGRCDHEQRAGHQAGKVIVLRALP